MTIFRWAVQAMCCLYPVCSLSAPDTLFINAQGAAVPQDQATYFRIRLPDSARCLVRDYDLHRILRREETYTTCAAVIREGPARYYDAEGRLQESGFYHKGRKSGTWTSYYSGGKKIRQLDLYGPGDTCLQTLYDSLTGRVKSRGRVDLQGRRTGSWQQFHFRSDAVEWDLQYRFGHKDGEQRQYYPDGSLQRLEIYRQGRFKKGSRWDEQGRKCRYRPSFVYPEPPQRLRKYLYAHCPCFERELPLGDLELHCTVQRDGTLRDVRITGPQSAPCLQEMEAAIRRMKKWKPAKAEEKAVDCPYVYRVRYWAPKE